MKKTRLLLRAVAACSLLLLYACAAVPGSRENGGLPETDIEVLAGYWEGTLTLEDQKLDIIVRFSSLEKIVGSIDIPQQGARELSLTNIRRVADTVYFELPTGTGNALFCGELGQDLITGTFTQSGTRGSFVLTRESGQAAGGPAASEASEAPAAPEAAGTSEASAPEQALSVDVSGGALAGTLELPEGSPPFPAALIIAGSGPTDRDGNSPLLAGGNDSLKLLARGLAEAGIASLRYDKRGVAGSGAVVGAQEDLDFGDMIDDAVRWVELLRQDDRFRGIVVVGHSQGSLVGTVAARRAGADAFVSVAGPGQPVLATLRDQLASQPEEIRIESGKIIARIEDGERVEEMSEVLRPLFRPEVQPFLRSWSAYDPAAEIARLEMPVLIVQGTRDLQVTLADAERLRAARSGAAYLEVVDMNHVLKAVGKDMAANLAAYSDPGLPLAPGLVEGLTAFLADALP